MNLSKLWEKARPVIQKTWDWLDIAIMVGLLVLADYYAFKAGQFWLGIMVLMCGGNLIFTEIKSKLKTGKTITQNFRRAWRENREGTKQFILSWLAFSIYLALHLTVLP